MTMEIQELLKEILDPETNHSIFDMGFLKKIEIKGKEASLVISPPTFWCPPTILYIILEDLRKKLIMNGYEFRIILEDHHDAEKITNCINQGLSFQECYNSEALGVNYEQLRKRLEEKQERKLGRGPNARLVNLSLNINGELCILLGEARQLRESIKNS